MAWIGSIFLLHAMALRTERILSERARETQSEMTRLEDDYRKIMRDLGYNVMIVPGDQDLASLRMNGCPDSTMPFEYVERLGSGGVKTLNHLLPVLQRRVQWPEAGIEILLSGTSGQIPVVQRKHFLTSDGTAYRDPIMQTVPPGEIVIGQVVAKKTGLRVGDETTLWGTRFRVRKVNPAEASTDDIAVWCDLGWAQDKLGLPGKINLILALECVCFADAIGEITADVQRLLPDVQILEFGSRVKTRALARARAEEAHGIALDAERRHRVDMLETLRRFTLVLTSLVIAGCAAWMFFLSLGNVRERRHEIGVLRAVGVSEHGILVVFLGRGILVGLSGAVIGVSFVCLAGIGCSMFGILDGSVGGMLPIRTVFAALMAAPVLSVFAVWLPAISSVRNDPATVLCEE
jgi:hypothetical protein